MCFWYAKKPDGAGHQGRKLFTPSIPTVANTLAQRDASGNLNATGFLQNSLASLKKNIQPFAEDALGLLMQVQIKQFIYKDDKQENVRIGIIADSTGWYFDQNRQCAFVPVKEGPDGK